MAAVLFQAAVDIVAVAELSKATTERLVKSIVVDVCQASLDGTNEDPDSTDPTQCTLLCRERQIAAVSLIWAMMVSHGLVDLLSEGVVFDVPNHVVGELAQLSTSHRLPGGLVGKVVGIDPWLFGLCLKPER